MKENKIEKKELMDIHDVSEYTGLTVGYLYQLTSKRLIPHYKPLRGKIYFLLSEINEMFFSHRISTVSEIDQQATNSMIRK